MSILILEPGYSKFHLELAKYLSQPNSIQYSFIFNMGNIIYFSNDVKKIFINKEIKKVKKVYTEYYNDILNTKTLYSSYLHKVEGKDITLSELDYMSKYMGFLKEFILEKKIDLVLMHNDLRWQHALAILICKELGIKYIVTERGLFRPNTTTVDTQGVNDYCSLPRNNEFYNKINTNSIVLKDYSLNKIQVTKINIKFVLFVILNKIGDLFRINVAIKNKTYSLLHYFKLFTKNILSLNNKENLNLEPIEKLNYIFIPLQVSSDTQLLVHSNFKTIQEFIDVVEMAFYSLNIDNVKLMFKIHPMEKGIKNYKFNSKSIVTDDKTAKLVDNCLAIITINSTVGFEGIQKSKPVFVLGNAFYKIKNIVYCSDKYSLKKDLSMFLNGENLLDFDIGNKFVQYVMGVYQINGSIFNYDKNTFEEIKVKLQLQ